MKAFIRFKAVLPVLAAVCAVAFNSCVLEPDPVGPGTQSENVTLRVNVPVGASPSTRALLQSDEYAVNDISVLAFDKVAKTLHGRYSGRVISGPTHISGASATVTFEVTLPEGGFDLMIVANGNKILAANSGALTFGASQASVEAALTMGMDTSGWNTNTASAGYYGIPMWGYVKAATVPDDFPLSSIYLTRMVAKVDLQLGSAVTTANNFQLHSVRVYNYAEQGRLIPDTGGLFDWSAAAPDNLAMNQTPTPPAGYTKANAYAPDYENLTYTVASPYKALANSIYLFESPKGVAPTSLSDYLKNTCLVIGGQYSPDGGTTWNQESWYRIDFARQADAAEGTTYTYLPILRNNSYLVTIASISGDGHGGPIEALESVPANIKAHILNWNDHGISTIVTDGVYRLSVSQGSFDLSFDAHTVSDTDNLLTIATDYHGGWTATVWDDEAGTVALSDDDSSGLPWLRLSADSGTGDYPTGNEIQLIADANNSADKRIAYIHIKAGVLNYIIKVTQAVSQLAPGSNCYMINNADPKTLIIPISQIGYAMGRAEVPANGFLGSKWIRDYTKLKAQVIWSDVNEFGTTDAVVLSATYNGATTLTDGTITIVPGNGTGNAGIILYEDNDGAPGYQYKAPPLTDSDDRIIWSWHIWKSDYYPYDSDGNPNAIYGTNTVGFMDRNIGAVTNAYSATPWKVVGFFYQWGRKDPHPSISAWSGIGFTIYLHYAPGSGMGFEQTTTPEEVNLPNSVMNPMTRYYLGTAPQDWFTNTVEMKNVNLWGSGTDADFLHPAAASGDRKSVYDPCPEGYRVPNLGDWGSVYLLESTTNPSISEAGWGSNTSNTNNGRSNEKYGGYYPAAGRRQATTTGLNSVGSFGYYWMATTDSFSGSGMILNFYSSRVSQDAFMTPAHHLSVRCRAE